MTPPDPEQAREGLKACPFCGGTQCTTAPGAFSRWFAVCKACGATTNSDDGEAEAIAAWNTRTDQPEAAGGVERVPSADLEARAREVLFDLLNPAHARQLRTGTRLLDESKVPGDVVLRAMLALAAQVDREATERAAKVAEARAAITSAHAAYTIAAAIRQEPRP